jgi:outer membrane protein OmpA-like peptidoglycan-associated protein
MAASGAPKNARTITKNLVLLCAEDWFLRKDTEGRDLGAPLSGCRWFFVIAFSSDAKLGVSPMYPKFRFKIATLTLSTALILLPALGSAGEMMTAEEIAYQLSPKRGISATTTAKPASVDLSSITFEFNSAELTDQARRQLDEVGKALTMPAFQDTRFMIGGHTDNVGSEAYNQLLSEKRAETVTAYLADNFGIQRRQLQAVGWGESKLKDSVAPEDAANRRVEIVNLGQTQ